MSYLTINYIVQENDLSTKLNKHRNKMINIAKKEKTKKKDAKALEKFLNETYFSKENNKLDEINNFIENVYENIQDRTLAKDFSITNSTYEIKDVFKMAREKYESFSHTNKIYLTTIQERIKKVKDFIKSLPDNNNSSEILRQAYLLKRDLEKINKKGKEFLMNDKVGSYINLQDDTSGDLISLVNQADELYKTLSACPILPKDYGDILEWSLGALNKETNILGEEITEELFDDFIKRYVSGGKKVAEGYSFSMPNNKLLKSYREEKTDENLEYKINDNFKFEYSKSFNPFSKRQMKMDVKLNLPEIRSTPFKISAKNWQSIGGQDFGQTNLIYALIRSANDSYAQRYGYILSYKKAISELLIEAHKLAKISIVLDILMGFSQRSQGGSADTLVILDRTNHKFQVKSIGWIIQSVNKYLDDFKIKDYNEGNLATAARAIRETVLNKRRENRSETLQSMLYRYFSSVNISLRYSDIEGYY